MADWKSAPVPQPVVEDQAEAAAEGLGFALPSLAEGVAFAWTHVSVFGIEVPLAACALPFAVGALYLTLARSRRHVDRRVLRHHDGSGAREMPEATLSGQ